MPIDSKECFAALTEDGQLWEIYQAAQTGGGGGAPTNASYVVISNDPTLTNERVLTQGSNITITDGGANNPVTVATVVDPTFDSVQIDTTPTAPVTPAVGKILWNDTDGTLEFGLKGGNVNLQVGQENVVLVKNDDVSPLAAGEVVYISGANGVNLLVKRAKADADATSASTIGIVSEAIAVNGQGFITTFGVVKNINTNAFNDGDILYLSPTTAGAATNVKPSAPDHLVLVGFVQKKSAGAGEIFVEIQNGYELKELHDVQINTGTLANNDLLAYNLATQTWQNKTVASAGGITSVAGAAPISASTASGAVTVTTSIATNKVVGRSTSGTGVMEELTPVGITVSGGNITGIGGTVGTVDNAVPRADGTGGYTVQGSDIVIDDATTSTANNVAITNQHAGQTNSSLVLTPKGTGALIAGPKPDGTATGGNARGARAVDLQSLRANAAQVASGGQSFIGGGNGNTASNSEAVCSGGISNTASGDKSVVCGGRINSASAIYSAVIGGDTNAASADSCLAFGRNSTASAFGAIAFGREAVADRNGMDARAAGRFAANGDAQRARFVLRNSTASNTPTELFIDGSSTRLTIPVNKAMGFTIQVIGSIQGMAENAFFVRKGMIVNDNATTTLVGSVESVGTDQKSAGATATDVTVTASDANDALIITVTGIAAQNWRWVASVDAVEVQYA